MISDKGVFYYKDVWIGNISLTKMYKNKFSINYRGIGSFGFSDITFI